MNRQFRLVTLVTEKGPDRLVLEEAYDVRHCLTSGSSSSEATITAWRPDSAAGPPVFRIAGRGSEGDPAGNLYAMATNGCCGSRRLITYYSLRNGAPLFTSSIPVRVLRGATDGQSRFAAFHDTFSAGSASEAAADSTVIGVLQWGDDRTPARRFVVRADRPEAFALDGLGFVRNQKETTDTVLTVRPGPAANLALAIRLTAANSNRSVTIRVPIAGYDLDVGRAEVPHGFRLTPGR